MNRNENPITIKEKKRLLVLAILVFCFFSILIAQFYKIQIIEGEKWTKEARKQHFFLIKESFQRGTFYSNTSLYRGHIEKPRLLVVDILKYHLYIDPASIPEILRDQIAQHLIQIVPVSSDEEKKTFREQFDKKSRSRKLAMWLDKETRDSVTEWWKSFAQQNKIARNAVYFVNDYQRSYPFGKFLGQVLHTIRNNKDEKAHQALPTGGLELYFNQYLSGRQGKRLLMRSPRNSFEMGTVIEPPQNGADIYLTINCVLQAIAEEELAAGVKKAKAKAGWAIMMDPKTGEILALAQYPFFYPPDYQLFFNDPEQIANTKVKAITDANEPGSIMKPITLAVALKANEELKKMGKAPLFDPEAKMNTSDTHFRGRKPLKDLHPHFFLNMNMALQKSSNVYMARLMERVVNTFGDDWYRAVLHETFGLGTKTHVELPGESRGLLPTPGKKHPNGALEWSTPTPFSLAIGHNIQATSLQMLRVYATFANGGYLVEPTLVRKIVKTDHEGKKTVLVDNCSAERYARFPKVLEPETVDLLVKALKYVTKPGGAAARANIPGFTDAGKTGTAEKIVNGAYAKNKNCSSFIGFTPVQKSAFVLMVVMDEPEVVFLPGIGKNSHGGTCAAPVFCKIAKRSLEYLGIVPDDPHGYPIGDPRYNPEKADWVKEARLLKELYAKWNMK